MMAAVMAALMRGWWEEDEYGHSELPFLASVHAAATGHRLLLLGRLQGTVVRRLTVPKLNVP